MEIKEIVTKKFNLKHGVGIKLTACQGELMP